MANRGYMSVDAGTTIHLWLSARLAHVFARLDVAKRSQIDREIKISRIFTAVVSPHSVRTGFGEANYLIKINDIEGRSWYTIAVNKRPCKTIPDLVVRLNYPACRIQRTIGDTYVRIVEALFKTTIKRERLSRVDIAFTINDSAKRLISKIMNKEFVSHLKLSNASLHTGIDTRIQSLALGSRDKIRLSIYDKCEEVLGSSNADLKTDDVLSVFRDDDEICRIEFSVNRSELRNWSVETVSDFNKARDSIAQWLTKKFFRVVNKKTYNNTTRDKIDTKWCFLTELTSQNVYYVRQKTFRRRNKFSNIKHLRKMGVGVMSSLCARIGGSLEQNFDILAKWLLVSREQVIERAKFKRSETSVRFDLGTI